MSQRNVSEHGTQGSSATPAMLIGKGFVIGVALACSASHQSDPAPATREAAKSAAGKSISAIASATISAASD